MLKTENSKSPQVEGSVERTEDGEETITLHVDNTWNDVLIQKINSLKAQVQFQV